MLFRQTIMGPCAPRCRHTNKYPSRQTNECPVCETRLRAILFFFVILRFNCYLARRHRSHLTQKQQTENDIDPIRQEATLGMGAAAVSRTPCRKAQARDRVSLSLSLYIYIYIYVLIYLCLYIYLSLSLSLSIYIYIYIFVYLLI